MADERLFVDTSYLLAACNRRDHYHERAMRLSSQVERCRELWTSEAILLEVGASCATPAQREIAVRLWGQFHSDPRCRLVPISGGLLDRAMAMFRHRSDKSWSLADCASFVLMSDHHLTDALSCDHHFVQAGFRALLLEEDE